MENTYIKGPGGYTYGLNLITQIGDAYNSRMDFGILVLGEGETFTDETYLERAFLLISGNVEFTYDAETRVAVRANCFDESPWVLHVPQKVRVTVTGIKGKSELSIHRTQNRAEFSCHLYTPEECISEMRGEGTLRETSTRIVRTVFNKRNAPLSNLVLGEVIGMPGKWSSYPPHYHAQPEIYYYRTLPQNGYGYCDLGNEILRVQNNDTVVIANGQIHPHVAAPGYALWYLWVIRHLDNDPYIDPTFVPEHTWTMDKDAQIWPYRK